MRLYPDHILLALPEGSKDAIKQAAGRYRLTVSDYLREALAARLELDGIDLPELLADRRAHLPVPDAQ